MRKIKIDKLLNVPKLIHRLWICLWVIELIMMIGKFCFNYWYPIICEFEWFINLCNFLDNNNYVRLSIYILLYILNLNIWYLTNTKRMRIKKILPFILINLLIISNFFIKNHNNLIGFIIEILILVILPILYNIKNNTFKVYRKNIFVKNIINILLPIIIYILLNIWQANIMFIRDVDIILTNSSSLVALILQGDYYIFTIITWMGVNYYMGILGAGWWWHRPTTELEAMKAEELLKSNPDLKLIADIDHELEKRKSVQ